MKIIKRDGAVQEFDSTKIYKAIHNCVNAHGLDIGIVQDLATEAVWEVISLPGEEVPVEDVQDIVTVILRRQVSDELADRYTNYRAAHAVGRARTDYADDPFQTELQRFQYFDKYARWNDDARRRETWEETVTRTVDYLRELSDNKLGDDIYERLFSGIYKLEVMPSMRLLAMAGKAARANQLSIYNCSYVAVDSIAAFAEILFLSMSGCGVGYSVEKQNISQLPSVKERNDISADFLFIGDSTTGWVSALQHGLERWFNGGDMEFDYSLIRPKGAVLKTKGGRASGPDPLRQLLDFARQTILNAAGRQLTPLECHDIICKAASVVIQGGVRRTAMISLFDLDDDDMLHCKDSENIKGNEQRWFANNSAVWTKRMSYDDILAQVRKIAETGTGEPGIFSRRATSWTKPVRRKDATWGVNPCGEIALRSQQLCNLSVAIARPDDTLETLHEKVEMATIIGTIQSMATDFSTSPLRDKWQENCEEERLLGVDIIGQMDCPAVQQAHVLKRLRNYAVHTNKEYAAKLGIKQSAAVTCIKPSGNSSTLLDASPGVHPRHAPYYIRRARVATTSPLYHVLRQSGVSMSPENKQTSENATTWVISFPVESPDGAKTKKQYTALEQLKYWLTVKTQYTEHNPSATILFKQDEVIDIAKFLFYNQEIIGGLSFLPANEGDIEYAQLPYEEISKQRYDQMVAEMPKIDYSWLPIYEATDATTVASEIACVAGACDL